MINEVEINDINMKPFKVKKNLNPDFFDSEGCLNSQIRMRLLDIADDFIKTLEVKWVKPLDIVITGSIVNYNWSEYSDVDVHVVYDYSKIYKKTEFVQDYFMSKRDAWNKSHDKLTIKDFPVELSVENVNAPLQSSGVYSLEKNEWVKEPKEMDGSSIDVKGIQKYCAEQMTKMDELFAKMDKEKDRKKLETLSDELQTLLDNIHDKRVDGLKTKEKELSDGNIMWKVIKHMGYADKVHDYINKVYDRRNTIDEKQQRIIRISESQSKLLKETKWVNRLAYNYLGKYLPAFKEIVKLPLGKSDLPKIHSVFDKYYNGIVCPRERVDGMYMEKAAYQVINSAKFRAELKNAFAAPQPTTVQPAVQPQRVNHYPKTDYTPAASRMETFFDEPDISMINEAAMDTFDINQLKSLKTFKDRLAYCKQELGLTFGSGSSRVIFEIDDDKVLKLAKNNKGIAQNEAEADMSRYSDCVVHCYECAPNYEWVIEENCIPAKPQDFQHFLGISFDDFTKAVQYQYEAYAPGYMNRFLGPEDRAYCQEIIDKLDEADDYNFLSRVMTLMGDYQLPSGDLMRISSYGIVQREGNPQLVILDSGLTTNVYDEYYSRKRNKPNRYEASYPPSDFWNN